MKASLITRSSNAWRRRALAALLVATAAGLSLAGSRDFWRFETSGDFLAGESDGVSIGPEGQVRLAPALRNLHESEEPFVWSVTPDGSGGVIAGGGAQGTLIRIREGASEVLADTGEVGIHAVAVAADGTVYFATAPGGSVQRILPGGERGVFHQPEARYIWAIVPEPGGSVLVATGMPASVIRVQPSGGAETIFTTSDENVTALHRAPDGTIHLGTEPSGIVFRIDNASGAMALYDSPFAEIRALALNAAGEVFAAAVADSGGGAGAGAAAAPMPSDVSSPQRGGGGRDFLPDARGSERGRDARTTASIDETTGRARSTASRPAGQPRRSGSPLPTDRYPSRCSATSVSCWEPATAGGCIASRVTATSPSCSGPIRSRSPQQCPRGE